MIRALWCAVAPALLLAQAPRIGSVEFYGLRKVSEERVGRALGLKPGDPLSHSKTELEDALERIPGVVQARLEAVCCEGGNAVLFVGIEERGAPHFAFRSPPAGDAVLPQEIVSAYRGFLTAVANAARKGNAAEDLTQGHSRMADPDARAYQDRFLAYARDRTAELRSVLRDSAEEEQRAIAAAVMGYAPNKNAAIDDLQFAMQDPDESVRANAMRALGAIAVLAIEKPDLGLKISPTWFIEMLNSVVLSDRVRAAAALVTLTEKDGGAALEQIRERALDSVVEMARWKSLREALPAFILAGRMAGFSEPQIHEMWSNGERQPVLEKVMRKEGKK